MRREYKVNTPPQMQLPDKIFHLDMLNTANTATSVIDEISGRTLTKEAAGTTIFVEDPHFGRCLKVTSRSVANVYSANWSSFKSGLAYWNNFLVGGAYTMAMFVSGGDYASSSNRGGVLSWYNVWRGLGYLSNANQAFQCASFNYYGVRYTEFPNNSDIRLYIIAWDTAAGTFFKSKNETGFTSLEQIAFQNEVTQNVLAHANANTIDFGKSQESNYYMSANCMVSQVAIYAGCLTNEQVAHIYVTKRL
jgi:hypothetical protein